MDTKILLELKNLSVDFKVDRKTTLHAVKDLSFQLREGETLGILGESGCGKSVSCMSILQLNPAKTTFYPQGEILFDGKDLLKMDNKKLKDIRGNEISMIFQEPMTAMNPVFTIGDQLMEAVKLHNNKISKLDAEDMVMDAIRSVNIPNPERVFKSYPFTLSGGTLQRCMIAMAMLSKPKILIADEPTTALDVTIQSQVLGLMNELKEKNSTSIIIITHDLGVISEMSDYVMVMYGGRKCEEGSVKDVLLNPKHPYTKGLIASHLTPDFKGDRLPTIPGNVPSLKDIPNGCPFQNRCESVCEKCKESFPEFTDFGGGHKAACYTLTGDVDYE